MNELKFNSLQELYARVFPALRSKVKELKLLKINYIKEEDIWNTLKNNKWNNSKTLTLAEMVDDILNTDVNVFIKQLHNELENTTKDADTEGENILNDSK